MHPVSLFCALNADRMAALVRQAKRRICYACPGIQRAVASAIAEVLGQLPPNGVTVSVDFDERVMRMGYGDIEAVRILCSAGVQVRNSPGLRSAVLVVDDQGFVFTPTALYLEPEPQSEETPNAIRLQPQQIEAVLLRLSPAARAEALAEAQNDQKRSALADIPLEVGVHIVPHDQFCQVDANLKQVPPVKFDVVRQVRVFEPYLQYVELSLTGAAIQRHRIAIPKSIQNLGNAKDLEGRLRTTFELIERSSQLSSKALETKLNEIRHDLTPSLGKEHGRVVLKAAKPHLLERLAKFRTSLGTHQTKVEKELQTKLDDSKTQVVEYYLPLARANPPDAIIGQLLGRPTVGDIRKWLETELEDAFPKAKDLTNKMVLEERYKDVTFETLNRPDFLDSVKEAFSFIDWDKAYNEFKAAGEANRARP